MAAADNIFTWYESNIGVITPIMADILKEAEKQYPEEWIKEALQVAVNQNVRKWSYVSKVLDRWQREGKGGTTPVKNYTAGIPEPAKEYDDDELKPIPELAPEWISFFESAAEYTRRVILPHMAPRRREESRIVVETDSEYYALYGADRFAKGLARWYGLPVVFEAQA